MARRAKSSADYWREREAEQRRHDITDRMAYNREVRRIYQSTQDNIQKEIDAFYGKYAKKEGITLAEAKRRVSRLEMEEYERKAARYVKEKNFSKQANEEMRLYNLTMKVNRLEMLKANIGLELTRGFDELDKTCGEKLNRHATKEFERLAGILGDTVRDNARYVHAIVNASFHNATFSERIWTNQAALKASLDTQIQRGLIQGRNSLELARAIGREFEVSRKDAERLMITEMRRVRTEVAKQSYEENGNKEYQFLALGARPCDKCLDIDGQVFPVKEMMPGVNAPPMHPRCECTTAPYWDEEKFQAWLDSGAAADGVPWEEFEEGLNATGKSAGDEKETTPGKPAHIATVDFSDKGAVMQQLSKAEKSSAELDYEVNHTVTADGKVWMVIGDSSSVDTSLIPSNRRGSYSYHNHPKGETHFSFSGMDAADFISSGEAYSKASDHLYEYSMRRTADTVEKSYEDVYHRFKEIYKSKTLELAFNEMIDIDVDGHHETMKRLSEEMRFEYDRKKKKG